MIWLVCINHHQPDSVEPMAHRTLPFGNRRVLVLDRSPEVTPYGWPHAVRNFDGSGFLAGRMRDLGLSYVREIDPDFSGVLFVDGDRIPQDDLLPLCVGDAVLFSVVDDMRGEVPGRLVDCTEYCMGLESSFTSPALYLSRKCIDAVLEDGRLFAACFDGLWGEEDRDLGDRVVRAGFRVHASNACVAGKLVDRYADGEIDPRNSFLRKSRNEKAKLLATTN